VDVIAASIVSDRLVLMPMVREDIADLARIASDESIFRYIPDIVLPFDAGRWTRSMLANEDQCIRHIMRSRNSFEAAGFVQVGRRRNAQLQLGFFLARSQWGRGYAREACASVLDFVHAQGMSGPVHAAVHRENSASMRVLARLGFRPVPSSLTVAGLHPDMIDHVRQRV
jgi:RimJ/RimL family protein N-acetyltransferase